jgi:hypothetical protein
MFKGFETHAIIVETMSVIRSVESPAVYLPPNPLHPPCPVSVPVLSKRIPGRCAESAACTGCPPISTSRQRLPFKAAAAFEPVVTVLHADARRPSEMMPQR